MNKIERIKNNTYKKQWIIILIKLRNLNLLIYCLIVGLLAISGAFFLLAITQLLGTDIETQLVVYSADFELNLGQFLAICIVGPVVETAILSVLLLILFKSKLTPHQCCIVSALFWGSLHGILAPIKFLTASWTFFVFSVSFWLWKKFGYKKSFLAAALPHIILNSVAYFLIFF